MGSGPPGLLGCLNDPDSYYATELWATPKKEEQHAVIRSVMGYNLTSKIGLVALFVN